MRAAERGEEVVEGIFIREVDDREAGTSPVLVAMEEVIFAHGEIE